MDFTQKLNEVLLYYKISPTALADKINVQRSSISHLLSGRNKPSLDFIVRLTDVFPELNFDWLVRDRGQMITLKKDENSRFTNVNNNIIPTLFDEQQIVEQKKSSMEISNQKVSIEDIQQKENNPIAKILILYKDGSFEVYQ